MKGKLGLLVLLTALGAAVAAAAFVGALGPSGAGASSHREAPLISDDPSADNTDVYAFVSPDAAHTVTLIANYIPFEDPAGGPNYYRFDPTALYELKVDNNGRRRGGRHLPVPVQDDRLEPEHVPLQHEPGHISDRPRSERQADLHGHPRDVCRVVRARHGSAGSAGEHRPPLEPDVRPVSGSRGSRPRPQGVRGPTRRSVLRGPGVDLRPRRPPAVQHGARHPAPDGSGQGRRPQLQHALDRDPGAEDGPASGTCRKRDDRRLCQREPAADPRPERQRDSGQSGTVGAGLAARKPADQRGGHPARARRTCGTRPIRRTTHSSSPATRPPSSQVWSTSCTRCCRISRRWGAPISSPSCSRAFRGSTSPETRRRTCSG